MERHGLLGRAGNIFFIAPPLCVTRSELDFLVNQLDAVIAELQDDLLTREERGMTTRRLKTYVVNLKRRGDRRARMERVLPASVGRPVHIGLGWPDGRAGH